MVSIEQKVAMVEGTRRPGEVARRPGVMVEEASSVVKTEMEDMGMWL